MCIHAHVLYIYVQKTMRIEVCIEVNVIAHLIAYVFVEMYVLCLDNHLGKVIETLVQ